MYKYFIARFVYRYTLTTISLKSQSHNSETFLENENLSMIFLLLSALILLPTHGGKRCPKIYRLSQIEKVGTDFLRLKSWYQLSQIEKVGTGFLGLKKLVPTFQIEKKSWYRFFKFKKLVPTFHEWSDLAKNSLDLVNLFSVP